MSKRYLSDWIFYEFSQEFRTGERVALLGPNGSGKSTLLQVLAQSTEPSSGTLHFLSDDKELEWNPPRHLAIAAPYLELIEEMTALELIDFHFRFKPLMAGCSPAQLLDEISLTQAAHKQIRLFSSGMKQRLKLGLAFMSDTPVLFLDEPCTNLDTAGYALYYRLTEYYTGQRIVILASNDPAEQIHCTRTILLDAYRP